MNQTCVEKSSNWLPDCSTPSTPVLLESETLSPSTLGSLTANNRAGTDPQIVPDHYNVGKVGFLSRTHRLEPNWFFTELEILSASKITAVCDEALLPISP